MKNLKHINEFLKVYENNSEQLFVDESKMKSLLIKDQDFIKGEILQAFYNINYSEHEGNLQQIEKKLGKLPTFLELFGNYDGQVNNGGHQQYLDNGYASEHTSGFGGNHTETEQHEYFVELFRKLNMPSVLGEKAYNIIQSFEYDGAPEPESCYNCDGNGYAECKECGGDTRIECPECYGEGTDEDGEEDCPECGGDGTVDCDECDNGEIECDECGGSGEVEPDAETGQWDHLDNEWYDINEEVEEKLNNYLKSLTLDGEKMTDLVELARGISNYNL